MLAKSEDARTRAPLWSTDRHLSASGSGLRQPLSTSYDVESVAPNNVISIGPGGGPGHPAVFPLGLPAWFIRLLSSHAGTVLDPFMGSGTTAIADEREGRTWIGIERSAEYVRLAGERIRKDRLRCLGRPADTPDGQQSLA